MLIIYKAKFTPILFPFLTSSLTFSLLMEVLLWGSKSPVPLHSTYTLLDSMFLGVCYQRLFPVVTKEVKIIKFTPFL